MTLDDFSKFANVVGTIFGMLCAYLLLSRSRRSEAHVWIENSLLVGLFCYAAFFLYSFWTDTGPPSRGAILLAIYHTLLMSWAPKSIVDGYFQRREMARARARIAMMEKYMNRAKEDSRTP